MSQDDADTAVLWVAIGHAWSVTPMYRCGQQMWVNLPKSSTINALLSGRECMHPPSHHNMVWWFIVMFKSWLGGEKHQIMHNTFFCNQFIEKLWPGYCHIVIHPCTCWASGQNIVISFDESNICETCTINFASAMIPPSINAYKLLSPDQSGNLHKPLTLWVKESEKFACVCLWEHSTIRRIQSEII